MQRRVFEFSGNAGRNTNRFRLHKYTEMCILMQDNTLCCHAAAGQGKDPGYDAF